MQVILVAIFSMAAGLLLLSGVFYQQVKMWSYLAAGVCGLHLALSLVVARCRMVDAGRIAAWCWQGISSMLCIGLLLAKTLRDENGWLLAAAVLGGFTLLVTLVLVLVIEPDSSPAQQDCKNLG